MCFYFSILMLCTNVMWSIHSIQRINKIKRTDILPTGTFILRRKNEKIKVFGFLPVHHSDVEFKLKLSSPDSKKVHKIVQVLNIVSKNPKKIQAYKHFAKKLPEKLRYNYIRLVEIARPSTAIWTVSCVYKYFDIPNDINMAFRSLVNDFTNICRRGSTVCRKDLLYNYEKSVEIINRGLIQMGELPKATEWNQLKNLHEWQLQTKFNTASWKKPIFDKNVQKYKGKWSDTADIEAHKKLMGHFTSKNTTIIRGDPAPSLIPKNAYVIVRNEEDAYKWKCRIESSEITMIKLWFDESIYKKTGVFPLTQTSYGQPHVYIAYAHLWDQLDWLSLVRLNHDHYTILGRLDQYPRGRGNTFRDMCDSNIFKINFSRHIGAECIENTSIDELASIVSKHGVVQCFSEDKTLNIDTNRRQLDRPFRIRTIRKKNSHTYELFEESPVKNVGKNMSLMSVKQYSGIQVRAVVYICTEHTTSFDIHVARSYCSEILYIIGDEPSMFSFERKPKNRVTIDWE